MATIETRFGLGDMVWAIWPELEGWRWGPGRVVGVGMMESGGEQYVLEESGGRYTYYGRDVFATEAEAEATCSLLAKPEWAEASAGRRNTRSRLRLGGPAPPAGAPVSKADGEETEEE